MQKTASSSIAKELKELYDGEDILWKHARLPDFLAIATSEEKKYFIFAGVRNPLDIIVSEYHLRKKGKGIQYIHNRKQYNFINKNNADFKSFFKKFFAKKIFNDWKTIGLEKVDYLYKYKDYEQLQKNFSEILKKIGLKQIRSLPVFNKTADKKDYSLYYTPDIQPRAKLIFEDYIKKWGFEFPEGWKEYDTYDKIMIMSLLNIKYFFYKITYKLLGYPLIYKIIYGTLNRYIRYKKKQRIANKSNRIN